MLVALHLFISRHFVNLPMCLLVLCGPSKVQDEVACSSLLFVTCLIKIHEFESKHMWIVGYKMYFLTNKELELKFQQVQSRESYKVAMYVSPSLTP